MMSVNEWKKMPSACLDGFKGNHKGNNSHSHPVINSRIVIFNDLDQPFFRNYKPYDPPDL